MLLKLFLLYWLGLFVGSIIQTIMYVYLEYEDEHQDEIVIEDGVKYLDIDIFYCLGYFIGSLFQNFVRTIFFVVAGFIAGKCF